jgi:hypothetical protein
MALYAFDGTWNEEKDNDTIYANTNVVRFFQAYDGNSPQTKDYYRAGVGTRLGVIRHHRDRAVTHRNSCRRSI